MESLDISEARALAEQKLDKDRERVIKIVGMRLSQVRHVLNQLQKEDTIHRTPEWMAHLKQMTPPMSDEMILEYALNTHEYFTQHLAPFTPRARDPAVMQWMAELEDTLADVRRIVVQNLSKHPAMKPYRALGLLIEEYANVRAAQHEREECVKEYTRLQHDLQRIHLEKADAQSQPGFATLTRLEESREELMAEKRAILEQWTANWQKVEPIFNRLLEKSKTFERLENAQLRMLQLYLANPVSARMKDPRGAGFLMLLRLAVDAIEEKKVFHEEEREMAREQLLETIQNPSFSAFFERTFELDQAIEANLREYYAHPLHHLLTQIETEERVVQRKMNEVQTLGETVDQQYEEKRRLVERLAKETDEVCQNNLGIRIRRPE